MQQVILDFSSLITAIGVIFGFLSIGIKWILSLKKGVQALLRSQLYAEYHTWKERGYAPIWARENFINMYNQYHGLHRNGVMDDIKEAFLALPTEMEEKGEKNERNRNVYK